MGGRGLDIIASVGALPEDLWLRVLTRIGGALIGLGLFAMVFALAGGLGSDGAGSYAVEPLLIAVPIAVLLFIAARRLTSVPTFRSVADWAAFICVLSLTFCAYAEGYVDTRTGSYTATMKSDLYNLVAAQDEFRRTTGRYADEIPTEFRTSTRVSAPRVALTPDGWHASVTHDGLSRTCVIFVGRTPSAPAVESGVPACTPEQTPPTSKRHYLPGLALLGVGLLLSAFAFATERLVRKRDAAA